MDDLPVILFLVIMTLTLVLPFLLTLLGLNAAGRLRKTHKLASWGTPARGLVLQVAPVGIDVRTGLNRYERRNMVMDVEIPGRQAYLVNASQLIPKQIVSRVLPGTFLELRVDPSHIERVAIVGPGGVFFVE